MRRVSYILLALVALVVLGLLSSIVNHGFDELAAAEEERAHLEERTIELSDSISEIEATLEALRSDSAAVESLARLELGWVRPGDTVRVHVKIIEGSKERIQVFEGVVIALKHGGMDRTFTVRKTSWGVGVERTFFLNSTKIDRIELVRRGRVRMCFAGSSFGP